MRSLPRIAVVVSAVCWVAGIAALLIPGLGPVVGAGLLTAGVLAAVAAAMLLVRGVQSRLDALEARLTTVPASIKTLADRLPALPSSSVDWAPRPTADPGTVAALQALAARIDLLPVLAIGDLDPIVTVETLAAIEAESPMTVLVIGDLATAAAIAACAPSTRVVAATSAPDEAERFRRAARRLGLADRVDVVDLELRSGGGEDGSDGYDPAALRALPPAEIVLAAGPRWSLGPRVRNTLADFLRSRESGVTTVLVPEPHRSESQAFVARLVDGGRFTAVRDARGSSWFRRPAP